MRCCTSMPARREIATPHSHQGQARLVELARRVDVHLDAAADLASRRPDDACRRSPIDPELARQTASRLHSTARACIPEAQRAGMARLIALAPTSVAER